MVQYILVMSAWVPLLFVLVVAALNILRKQGRVVLQEPGALHWIPLLLPVAAPAPAAPARL